MPNRLERIARFFRPHTKAEIPFEIREASHRLNNAAMVSQGRNVRTRREMDIMQEWIRDMRRQDVST